MFTDHFSVGDTFWEAAVNTTNSIIRILELIFSMGKGGQKINRQDMYIHFIVFYKLLNDMGKKREKVAKSRGSKVSLGLGFHF